MKREIIKEAILLDEPIEELPPVDVTPIEIEEPKVDDEIKTNTMSSIIANEITHTYDSIDSIKSIIATISSEMPDREDVIAIMNQLVDDSTIHIGMLQKAMDLIDGKSSELIDTGIESAEIVSHTDTHEGE